MTPAEIEELVRRLRTDDINHIAPTIREAAAALEEMGREHEKAMRLNGDMLQSQYRTEQRIATLEAECERWAQENARLKLALKIASDPDTDPEAGILHDESPTEIERACRDVARAMGGRLDVAYAENVRLREREGQLIAIIRRSDLSLPEEKQAALSELDKLIDELEKDAALQRPEGEDR
jgi:hypothetical protein